MLLDTLNEATELLHAMNLDWNILLDRPGANWIERGWNPRFLWLGTPECKSFVSRPGGMIFG
jgi:hypothetical protein